MARLVEEGVQEKIIPVIYWSKVQNDWSVFLEIIELLRLTAVLTDSVKESVKSFKIHKKREKGREY